MLTALLCLASLSPAVLPAADDPVDTVVVCPESFREALGPWIEYRQGQGHRLAFVAADQSDEEIRAAIRAQAQDDSLRFVVLVGDAEPAADDNPQLRARCVPTHLADAEINVAWGSEPQLPTDNWYADLDDDLVPDLAVGRLPADTPEELSSLVERIITYEHTSGHGLWRRQVNLVAGVGGFGGLVDGLLETATRRFLTEGIPAGYRTSVTYGSWQSPYCPDPRAFRDTTLRRLNEGCLFWVYVGHGSPYDLDYVRVPGAALPIFEYNDVQRLQCAEGPPIALMLACYTAAFDAAEDCLAEEMLRTPGGPIAVLGGSRVTMPYAMAAMADGMLSEYFVRQRETLGEVLLGAKQRMVQAQEPGGFRQLLDSVALALSPDGHDLAAERLEHVQLFNLLGDPLLKLSQPGQIALEAPTRSEPGEVIELTGTSPVDGEATVELVCRRDRFTFTPPRRSEFYPTDASLAAYSDVYQRANNDRWCVQTCHIVDGELSTEIVVPSECLGACHLRVFVEGEENCALGASNLYVRRPRPSESEEAE